MNCSPTSKLYVGIQRRRDRERGGEREREKEREREGETERKRKNIPERLCICIRTAM